MCLVLYFSNSKKDWKKNGKMEKGKKKKEKKNKPHTQKQSAGSCDCSAQQPPRRYNADRRPTNPGTHLPRI